jgi:uncharacterized protein YbbK (DUF523 family)
MGDAHTNTQRPAVLVSACLLGVECNHRGQANPAPAVRALADGHRLVAICPETAGGLPTPRPASELQADGRVVTEVGDDVTDPFRRGATAAVALATAVGAQRAVLKARSPSCGNDGVTTRALREAGLTVESEEDLEPR